MRNSIFGIPGPVLLSALLACSAPAEAQSKPAESTSKVKKVMLYNKIGGWASVDGIAEIKAAFVKLAAAKGFQLTQVADDAGLTLDYLKQFQVIVWNNNTNGGASVPSTAARQAVLDYVNQGGGWLLLHGAGDHSNSWPALAEALGTTFVRRGDVGPAEVVLDSAALGHPELKWMLEGFPGTIPLNDHWFSFQATVRPLPGVTVVATARAVEDGEGIIVPMGDGGADHPYLWARSVGQGRLLYTAIGSGREDLMAQQDSIVPRLYWENLRYAAGDYQNGCANPASAGYDPGARVHVEALCGGVAVRAPEDRPGLALTHGGSRIRLAVPAGPGPLRARLRDIRGALAWERYLPAGTTEIALEGVVGPGVYHIEIGGAEGAYRQRLALP